MWMHPVVILVKDTLRYSFKFWKNCRIQESLRSTYTCWFSFTSHRCHLIIGFLLHHSFNIHAHTRFHHIHYVMSLWNERLSFLSFFSWDDKKIYLLTFSVMILSIMKIYANWKRRQTRERKWIDSHDMSMCMYIHVSIIEPHIKLLTDLLLFSSFKILYCYYCNCFMWGIINFYMYVEYYLGLSHADILLF